jgi:radical SAM protein with 4Fe4S-binding SPASM domain
MNAPPLRLIALEVTRTCTLACRHCRGDSHNTAYSNELSFDEITRILDNTATFASPIIIITGGEPLTRPDVFDIARYSTGKGFRTVLATCGHLLDDVTVTKLMDAGISRISVSLDGSTASAHDSFRGVPGAFEGAVRGLAVAKRLGLPFQINSTLTTFNIGELDALHNLAVSLGAEGFHPFLLVPMGRGSLIASSALSPDAYEDALHRIAELAEQSPIEIKPTCGPHYYRIIRQRPGFQAQAGGNDEHCDRTAGHRNRLTKGCLGGQGFVFVSHTGVVQMCGFLEIPAGDLRENQYDLAGIWESSPFFKSIRDLESYHGKCGICEFRRVCGGCRARAYYMNGDVLGEEPNCIYIPKGGMDG